MFSRKGHSKKTITVERYVFDFLKLIEDKSNTEVCDICKRHYNKTAYKRTLEIKNILTYTI